MFKSILLIVVAALVAGCASVPLERPEVADKAKQFGPPAAGNAGLYIFRSSQLGAALKKDILIDGKCLGETAAQTFFYTEVKGDQEHVIATESEFSPNEMKLFVKAGVNYFIRQYIRLGLFVGGANLEVVDEVEGKKEVAELKLAVQGTCGN